MSDLRKLLDECTVGPWEITDRKITKHGGAYDLISGLTWDDFARVAVRFDDDEADDAEGLANARLISMTPDLAAALLKAEEALEEIADRHIPDQPAALDISEAEYARRQHTELRRTARATLTEIRKLTGAA